LTKWGNFKILSRFLFHSILKGYFIKKSCIHNSTYVLKWNSSKFCNIAYYRMQIHILRWQFFLNILKELLPFFTLNISLKELYVQLLQCKWEFLKTLHAVRWSIEMKYRYQDHLHVCINYCITDIRITYMYILFNVLQISGPPTCIY
jgi:hypothetical protein